MLAGVVLGLPASMAVWGFWIEPATLVTRQIRLDVPGWKGTELRIAALSDLHIGSTGVGVDKLKTIVERVNAQNPDIVLIMGDYVIGGPGGESRKPPGFVDPEVTAEELKKLRAPLGVFSVLGNHDWWFNGERVTQAIKGAGITVLENQAIKIADPSHPFWLGGIADLWTRAPDLDATLGQVTDADPVLLFTHNPDIFPDVPPRVSLTVAGHTHGAQVNFPLYGRAVRTSPNGYVAGHIVERGRHLFVTTGIGTSILGVRFRVPPEIVILTVSGI
jgi:uncharacterized protein